MSAYERVSVIGAGAWGTALALVALRAGREACLWVRRPEQADALNQTRENALQLMADYDVVVDTSDNFPTRYLTNDACEPPKLHPKFLL